jgi:hypothetical protein
MFQGRQIDTARQLRQRMREIDDLINRRDLRRSCWPPWSCFVGRIPALPDDPGRDRIARRRVGSICKKPRR